MGPEHGNPLEELKRLFDQIESAADLDALKPVYFRLNEIVQRYPDDFDVQLSGSEIKERLLARGRMLKSRPAPEVRRPAAPPPAAPPPAPPPPPPLPVEPTQETLQLDEPPPTVELRSITPVVRPASQVAPPAPTAPPTQKTSRKAIALLLAGAVLLIAVVAVTAVVIGKRKSKPVVATSATLPLEVTTTPPGATVRVTGPKSEATCTSNCKVAVAAGSYQVTAAMDGFEPAAGTLQVGPARGAVIKLTLLPQRQSVRLLTDLEQAKVMVDDEPSVDLQEGQLVLEKVAPGPHKVKIVGHDREATFSFEIADARMPAVSGPVQTKNLIAVLVASFGQQARLVTSGGPWKLAVNGQAQGDAGPAGTDLTNFKPGVDEIVVGEGKDQHNIIENFAAGPMLTVFLKSDVNAGTLIVATGQDDVRVMLNGKEYRQRTKRGQLRIQTIGKVTVKVAKAGYLEEPPQSVEIKRGAEVRVQFDLKPQPQFGALEIKGGTPGAEVWVDQRIAGAVGADGSFVLNGVQPGDRAIEIRREQYVTKKLQRAFRAGQTVALAGADVVLAAATGTVRFTRNIPAAAITYRRGGEPEPREIRGNQIDLPAGTYAFSASAPGYAEAAITIQLAAGDNREIDFKLAAVKVAAPAPPPPMGMSEFEDSASWRKEGDVWVRKGGGFSPFRLPPKGVFTFTVELLKGGGIFRPGQIRWCVQHVDARNYLLYEMDRKSLWVGVVEKGKRFERSKTPHGLEKQKTYTIQVEVTPDSLVTKLLMGGEWRIVDTFSEPGRDFTQGQFGFLIQGNDEIAISDFKFVAR